MPKLVSLPTPLCSGPFHVADAARAGIGPGRLRSDDLESPFPGVRVPAALEGIDPIAAYAPRLRAFQYFSHWTAAQIHGLPVPGYSGSIHVTSRAPNKPPRVRGVVGHVSRTGRHTTVRGVSVAEPVDVWVSLSPELSVRQLIVLGDALVRRKHPLASMEELAAAVMAHKGKRGAKKLAAAFERVRPRTDSVKETYLRLDIVDFGLPEPEVNIEIRDASGRLIAIGDLGYRQWKVLAEYDGEQHRTDDKQFFRDVDRLDDLAEELWRVVRFNKSHVSRSRLHKLRRALLAAGWRP